MLKLSGKLVKRKFIKLCYVHESFAYTKLLLLMHYYITITTLLMQLFFFLQLSENENRKVNVCGKAIKHECTNLNSPLYQALLILLPK